VAIDGQTGRPAEGAWDEAVEGDLDGFSSAWTVASWEYDLATDRVYWFDSPAGALHLSEDHAAEVIEPILVAVRGGAPWEHYAVERAVADLDGQRTELKAQARPVFAPDGVLSGCVGIVTDVSEQRRTERALRDLVDRYKVLLEHSPDVVVVHQQGVIRYVNPAGERLAGAPSERLVGTPILDFIHPTSLEDTLERISLLTEPGMVSEPAEAVIVTGTGAAVAMESVSIRIDWQGEPGFQVILRDITERRRAEAALRYQANLLTQVSDAVIATDLTGVISSWNPAATALYGVDAVDALGQPVGQVLGAASVRADGRPVSGEVDHQTASGTPRHVQVSVAPVRDEIGELTGTVLVCRDLTERIERQAVEARHSAVVAALDEGILVVDGDGTIIFANESARAAMPSTYRDGMPFSELLDRVVLMDESGASIDVADHPVSVGLRTGGASSGAVIGVHAEPMPRWFRMSVQPLRDGHPAKAGAIVCSFSDITEAKRAETLLSFQATHDSLTHLPNRDLVVQAVTDARPAARSTGTSVAVLLVDIDRFKTVNDTFGHGAGDTVLRTVATRIVDAARAGDFVGRLAGDEFAVVCRGVPSSSAACELARRIAGVIEDPIALPSGRKLVVTASVGVAYEDTHTMSAEVTLAHADMAMYRAKQLGRARIELFDEQLRAAAARRLLVEECLRGAIDCNEVIAHYQPIVDARTGHVAGLEALARWEHAALGAVSPAEFIPIAEEAGLMMALGANVLRAACRDLARWSGGRSESDFMLSVNLSPRQLADREFVAVFREILGSTGADPTKLWLEVTESVLMEEQAGLVSGVLAELRGLGVHVLIDDFGTGYSSLAYLKRFPVEALKIDRSFVEGLGLDAESEAIVDATIRLAQSLHLRTIAEGVETEQQLAHLRANGCDYVQGFLFSQAVPAGDVRLGSAARTASVAART
jgi:diguanylate cyclase (GGDEF)-like protein/PAS domain S-box-containing protein